MQITGQHANGQQFENMTFDCGHAVCWSPNFSRESTTRPCMRGGGFVEAMGALGAARSKIRMDLRRWSTSETCTDASVIRLLEHLDDYVSNLSLLQFYKT